MDEIRIEPVEIGAAREPVRMEFNLVATGKATRIEVEQRGFGIWELEDGLLRRVRFFRTGEQARGRIRGGSAGESRDDGPGLIIY